jgi:tetratricopeptide (TPR) repeat protein
MSDEAFSISKRIENLWGQSYSRFFVGHIYWYLGLPDKAIQTVKQCVEVGAEAGFLPSQMYNKSYLAVFYAYLGEFDRALPLAKEALSVAEDIMPYYHPPALAMLGQIYHIAGKHEEAKEVYDEVVTISIELEPMLRGSIEAFKTLYHLSQGEAQLAQTSATSFLKIQKEYGISALLPEALMLLGQSCLLAGDLDRAAGFLDESCKESQELGFKWPLWQALAAMARLEKERGNQNEAKIYLTQATEIFAEIARNISEKETRGKFEQLDYWRDLLEF